MNTYSQDIHFSQFESNILLFNPGVAGIVNPAGYGALNFRNQWGFIGTPYQTLAFSFDKAFFNKQDRAVSLGAGINALRDQAGEGRYGKTQIGMAFSSILKVNKNNRVSIGIGANFNQMSVDFSKLKWGSQYNGTKFDPSISSNELNFIDSRIYFDFGLGGMWCYKVENFVLNAGASFYRITPQTNSFYENTSVTPNKIINFTTTIRKDWDGSKLSLMPSAMISMLGTLRSYLVGSMVRFRLSEKSLYTDYSSESAVSFGLYYRVKDAIIPRVQYEMKFASLGVAYDINASSLASSTRNGTSSFELFLRFNVNSKKVFNAN